MHINSFLNFITYEKRFSPHTISSYTLDLNQFAAYLEKEYDISDIAEVRHIQIRSWLVQLMQEGVTARTINRKVSTLQSYYKFLQKQGVLHKNPMHKVQAPKIVQRLPVYVELRNMQALFEHYVWTQDYEGMRNKTIMALFYGTGMRVSELTGLTLASFDYYSCLVKVLGKGNKERLIPFDSELKSKLLEYITIRNQQFNNPPPPSFFLTIKGSPLYRRQVYGIVHNILNDITTVEKRSPHILRHTFATHLLNNGADINAIKELLGHASLAATQVYTHNSIEKLKETYKQAHPKA